MSDNAKPRTIPEWLQAGPMDIPMPAASGLFTEPGPDAEQLSDDVSPERMAAWLEKEQERLREATGVDLSVRPGEEPTT